jgi:small subunit ribosomal protein S18e
MRWGFDVRQALVLEENQFQYVLRVLNTNIKGKEKVTFALTAIKGIGRRFANIIAKAAEIDTNKRYVVQLLNLQHTTPHT